MMLLKDAISENVWEVESLASINWSTGYHKAHIKPNPSCNISNLVDVKRPVTIQWWLDGSSSKIVSDIIYMFTVSVSRPSGFVVLLHEVSLLDWVERFEDLKQKQEKVW